MNQPIKLSPIHYAAEKWQGYFVDVAGWQVGQLYSSVANETAVAQRAVALCDQSHNGKIRVEGQMAAQLLQVKDLAINTGLKSDYGFLYRLRPDLFFITTGPGMEQKVVADLVVQSNGRNSLITITNVTHGNAELWLIGPRSSDLLSHLCGLDFADNHFPNNTAKQSSVAKTAQIIIRRDVGQLPAYGLVGARSFGVYLWQTIMEAGHDLFIEPLGQAALNQLWKQAE